MQLEGHNIKGKQIDHRDGNGLNNQIENLRLVNNQQNNCNKNKQINNSSGYKSVSWSKIANKWRAYIVLNKQQIHLGYFTEIIDAANAYNIAAIKYHGEFAKLN